MGNVAPQAVSPNQDTAERKLASQDQVDARVAPIDATAAVTADPPRQRARYVILYNEETELCADIPAFGRGSAGQPVIQYACRPGAYDNQQVRITPVGKHGRFLIQTRVNGSGAGALCYDLPHFGKVPKGTPISLYHCRAHKDNQLFYLRPVRGGNQIVHNITGMCLDVAGFREEALGTPLLLWPCSMRDDHLWGLPDPSRAPVHPLPIERCPAFRSWQDKVGGAQVHAKVTFRPSDVCRGRHVKSAYIRLRLTDCRGWPDTDKRVDTPVATSRTDTSEYKAEGHILDSPFPGCTARANYDFEYF